MGRAVRRARSTAVSLLLALGLVAGACGDEEPVDGSDASAGSGGSGGSSGSSGSGGSGGGGAAGSGGTAEDAGADASSGGAAGHAGTSADASFDAAGAAGQSDGGDAMSQLMPDFGLYDVNPNSPRYQELVSPKDYSGQVSAWYFGHST